MKIAVVPVTPFQQNCTLLVCEQTMKGAVVDPGGDIDKILDAVSQIGLTLEKIFLTHGHMDHAGATADLAERFNLPIEGPHIADKFWIDGMPQQARQFGLPPVKSFTPDRWLVDGDQVQFGDITLDVYHCPGHTPGHVVFFDPVSHIAQVGDVLFRGSIGRSDLPGGDHDQLIRSIKQKLWPLGSDVVFVPGHGPLSTFGEERRSNPFVAD
ncbi:MAG: MBL fold metallo-hydrolase [Alphaproteobacteria bacterium]|nr:MBL fold metallo-hydrolase [Alphaproteobacteria bacterium]